MLVLVAHRPYVAEASARGPAGERRGFPCRTAPAARAARRRRAPGSRRRRPRRSPPYGSSSVPSRTSRRERRRPRGRRRSGRPRSPGRRRRDGRRSGSGARRRRRARPAGRSPGSLRPDPRPRPSASRPIRTDGNPVALHQPRGGDPHHARMPALAGEHERGRGGEALGELRRAPPPPHRAPRAPHRGARGWPGRARPRSPLRALVGPRSASARRRRRRGRADRRH